MANILAGSFTDLVLNSSYKWKREPVLADFGTSVQDILSMLCSRATSKGLVVFRGILHGLEGLSESEYEVFASLAKPEEPPASDLKQLRRLIDMLDSHQPSHMVQPLRELFDEFGTAGLCLHYCRLHYDDSKFEQLVILATFVLMAHQSMKQRYVKTLSTKHANAIGLAATFSLSLEAMPRPIRTTSDQLSGCELVCERYGSFLQDFTNKKRSRQQQQQQRKPPKAAAEIAKFKKELVRRSLTPARAARSRSQHRDSRHVSSRGSERARRSSPAKSRRRSRSDRRRRSSGRYDGHKDRSLGRRQQGRQHAPRELSARAGVSRGTAHRRGSGGKNSSPATADSARAQQSALKSMKQLEETLEKVRDDQDDLLAVKVVAKRLITELNEALSDTQKDGIGAGLQKSMEEISSKLDDLVLPRDFTGPTPRAAWTELVACVPRSRRPVEQIPDSGIAIMKYILKHAPSVLKSATEGAEASLFKEGGVAESLVAMREATASVDILGPFPRSASNWEDLEKNWGDGRQDISDVYGMLLCAASKALSAAPPTSAEQNVVVDLFQDLVERVKTLTLLTREVRYEPQAPHSPGVVAPKEEEKDYSEGDSYSYSGSESSPDCEE